MALGISESCGSIRFSGCISTCCFDGCAARTFLRSIVQAPNEKQTDTQRDRADKQRDKNRRNNCKLYRRSTLLVAAHGFEKISHNHPNLIIAVVLIGVEKVLVTLSPGNNGA